MAPTRASALLPGEAAFSPVLGHLAEIEKGELSTDGGLALSVDNEGLTILWDMATGRPRAHFIETQIAQFARDAKSFWVRFEDRISVYDRTGKRLRSRDLAAHVDLFAYSPRTDRLALITDGKKEGLGHVLQILDRGRMIQTIPLFVPEPPAQILFDRTAATVALVFFGGFVSYDVRTGRRVQRVSGDHLTTSMRGRFCPDSDEIVQIAEDLDALEKDVPDEEEGTGREKDNDDEDGYHDSRYDGKEERYAREDSDEHEEDKGYPMRIRATNIRTGKTREFSIRHFMSVAELSPSRSCEEFLLYGERGDAELSAVLFSPDRDGLLPLPLKQDDDLPMAIPRQAFDRTRRRVLMFSNTTLSLLHRTGKKLKKAETPNPSGAFRVVGGMSAVRSIPNTGAFLLHRGRGFGLTFFRPGQGFKKLSGTKNSTLNGASWTDAGDLIATCAGPSVMACHSGHTGEPVRSAKVAQCQLTRLSPKGRWAVALGATRFTIVDTATGKAVGLFSYTPKSYFRNLVGQRMVDFSPDEGWMLLASGAPSTSPSLLRLSDLSQNLSLHYPALGFSRDSGYLVTALGGFIEVLDLKRGSIAYSERTLTKSFTTDGNHITSLESGRRCTVAFGSWASTCTPRARTEKSVAPAGPGPMEVFPGPRGYLLTDSRGNTRGELLFAITPRGRSLAWMAYTASWVDGSPLSRGWYGCSGVPAKDQKSCTSRSFHPGALRRALTGHTVMKDNSLSGPSLLMGPTKASREALTALPVRQLRTSPAFTCTAKRCVLHEVTPGLVKDIALVAKAPGVCIRLVPAQAAALSSLALLKGVTCLELEAPPMDLTPLRRIRGLRSLHLIGRPAASVKRGTPAQQWRLEGLAGCTALRTLSLKNVLLEPSTILPPLRKLERVTLQAAPTRGLRWLSRQRHLRHLDIGTGCISDKDGLVALASLSSLTLKGTGLKDLSFLKGMKNLSALRITGGTFQIPPGLLTRLPLSTLALKSNTSIRSLPGLPATLEHLDLSGARLSSIKGIEKLQRLRVLDISGTLVAELSGLSTLKKLAHLTLDKTPLTGLKALTSLKTLTHLSVNGTKVTTIAEVALLPNLTHLALSSTPVSQLKPLAGHPGLQELVLTGTRVTDIAPLFTCLKLTAVDLSDTGITWRALRSLHKAIRTAGRKARITANPLPLDL